MGSGVSVSEVAGVDDSKLVQQVAEFYKQNPERAQQLIEAGLKLGQSSSDPVASNGSSEEEHVHEQIELDILNTINAVRSTPTTFIPMLEERMKRYEGNVLRREGKPNLLTQEGEEAVRDCIEYLKSVGPVPFLELRPGLCKAASQHAKDIGASGSTSHTGSDKSTMQERIERFGDWTELIGENICFAENEPLDIVLSWLIDDAVSSRGHRKNIFNSKFKTVGLAVGPHKDFQHVCVADFAGDFGPKVEKLTDAMTVTIDRERKKEDINNLSKILASIPFPEIKEQVLKALENIEITIILNYKPGSIESRITEGGVTNVLSGTWSTATQPL